jgi:Domain of unknown function (DUF4136)
MTRFCVAILLIVPGALWAQKVNTEFDDAAPFSDYKTFALRNARLNSKNPTLNSELTRKRIQNDIRKWLAGKGLTEATTGKPDLNVDFTLGTVRKLETEAYPAGWRGYGTRIVRVPYAEGTLVIDLRDTNKRALVWRAVAVEEKSDPMKLEGKLDDMVKKSFEKYPPKPR